MRDISDQTLRIQDLRCLFTRQTRKRESECCIYFMCRWLGGSYAHVFRGLWSQISLKCLPPSYLMRESFVCSHRDRPHLSSPGMEGTEGTVLQGARGQTRGLWLARQLLHHLNFTSGFDKFFILFSLLINQYKSFQRTSQVSVFNKTKKTKEDRILVTLKMPIVLCTCYVCLVYTFQNVVHIDKLHLYKRSL